MFYSTSVLTLVITLLSFLACQKSTIVNQSINLAATDSLSLLAESVISTHLYERDLAISPNQDQIIYTIGDMKQRTRCLVSFSKHNDNEWQGPDILPISGSHQDIEPFFSPDGKRLYFASNRPMPETSSSDYNIWYTDIVDGSYQEPIPLDTIINTAGNEFYPSVSNNGNLYFTASRVDGIGREDIFVSYWLENKYSLPIVMDSAINTPLFEFNAYISPDESFIIFSSYGRSDDYGGGDLYVSSKNPDNTWSNAQNLGPVINSAQLDFCPFVDLSNHVFYFTSERVGPYNSPITSVNQLQQISMTARNGFGNIYKIDFSEVLKNL